MSELIQNSSERKATLKKAILALHQGDDPTAVRQQLTQMLQHIPYNEVVEVEQELIAEGLPETEILQLCDLHHQVMDGNISDPGQQGLPAGHPMHTFKLENQALLAAANALNESLQNISAATPGSPLHAVLAGQLNQLMDVDKHYRRLEYLLFPYLEKAGITGPPKVLWGKHDETRVLLKQARAALSQLDTLNPQNLESLTQEILRPVVDSLVEMVAKEEQILFPMARDTLKEVDWYEILQQSLEIGYCLVDPQDGWKPEGAVLFNTRVPEEGDGLIRLPSGTFTATQLEAILNSLPVDLTFVDDNDRVKYFSQGKERIFDRNRSILNREVQMCHPPQSVHVVEQILDDFRSGRQSRAPFWIEMGGQFIHIEYFALRDAEGKYLGTLEVSQNLTEKRALEGQQRLLSYVEEKAQG